MTKFLNNADIKGYIAQTAVTSYLLKADSTGRLVAAIAGTDYQAPTTALLPSGGTAGQILAKIDGTNYNAQWIDNFAQQIKYDVKLGAALSKGTPVYVSSANGTNIIVSASSNATEATSSKTLGLLETGGALNDIVKVVSDGLLSGLDTSTATIGDPVWLGANGALIFGLANKPSAPSHLVYIGAVTRVHAVNGEIFIKVQNGFELDELHNVALTSPSTGDGLFFETSFGVGLWKNKTIASVLGYTPANGANYLPLTGGTISGDLTISSTNPRLYFTDTDNNPDYFISNTDGTFTVYDVTNSVGRFKIYSGGNAEFTGSVTTNSTFNITNGLTLFGNHISTQWYNGVDGVFVNYVGYNGGTTQFRNFYVYDGKQGVIATFDGSAKSFTLSGNLSVNNGANTAVSLNGSAFVGVEYSRASNIFGYVGTENSASGGMRYNSVNGNYEHTFYTNSVSSFKLLSTRQVQFTAYTTSTSFSGTAAGYLAFDSSGNVITVGSVAATDNTKLPLAGGTMTGGLVQQAAINAWGTTTQGGTVGGIHLGAASAAANAGPAITFGARDASAGANAQAGIYINSDGNYGTRMYLATTDSYAAGSKTAVSISETGVVNFVRANATVQGNGILHAGNYSSYAIPVSGGINMTGTFGLNDNKFYLRTNGDNNHYLWNAADDWEEMVAYNGTGFRISTSTGTALAYFSSSYINMPQAPSGATLTLGAVDNSRVYNDTNRQSLVINAPYYPHLYINATNNAGNTAHGAVISMTGVLSAGGYRRWGMGIPNTDPSALSWGYYDNQSNPHYGVGGTLGYTTTGAMMWLDTGGNLQTTGSMRAPIFYDSNDTGYYADFASTSRMNTIVYDNLKFSGDQSYGFLGRNVYADTINGRGSDPLELNYYDGGPVRIGTGTTGSKALYAGELYDAGNRVLTYAGGTLSNNYTFRSNLGGYLGNLSSPPLQVYSESNNSAFMSFHKGGYYAVNFGLDADNVMRIGGWSASSNRWQLDMSGNQTIAGDYYGNNHYASGFFRPYGDYGIYSQDYGGYFRRNTNSYGTWESTGYAKNGWGGYVNNNNYIVSWMLNTSGDFGFLTQNGNWWNLFYNNGNNCWGIGTDNTYSGDGFRCIKYGSAQYGWTTWSDRRAKENISTITGALDKVLNMRGVYFNYIIDEAKNKRVGFIAQELQQALPEAVRYAEEIDEYNVEYGQIVSVLAEAVKEHYAKTVAQQIEIDALKTQLQTLLN